MTNETLDLIARPKSIHRQACVFTGRAPARANAGPLVCAAEGKPMNDILIDAAG